MSNPELDGVVSIRGGGRGSTITRLAPGDPSQGPVLVRVSKVVVTLAMVALGLGVASTVAKLYLHYLAPGAHHLVVDVARRFDLNHEVNIPTWFSSAALLGSSFLLATIAVLKRKSRGRFVGHWMVLSAVFVYLSIDEVAMLHETMIRPMRHLLHAHGILYFTWVVPAAVLLVIFGLAYIRFFFHLDSRTKLLFVLAGVTFVGGAFGLELVGGVVAEQYGTDTMLFMVLTTIEELLEMLGVTIFIGALLYYIERHVGEWRIRVEGGKTAKAAAAANPVESAAWDSFRDGLEITGSLASPSPAHDAPGNDDGKPGKRQVASSGE
jgi:hypothetical protein